MPLPPIYDSKVSASRRLGSHPSNQNGAGKRHTSPPPSNDNGLEDDTVVVTGTSSGISAVAVKRDVAADFRILVAARIRPFTKREVRQWRQERRAASGQEDAEEARRTRSALRQPFGPDHKSLNATQTGLDGMWTRRHDDDGIDSDRGSLDVNEVPPPVVEVESDGKTVVLLDAQCLSSDSWTTTAPVRNAFTYDYVYSSFAPNVELDAQLTKVSPTGQIIRGGGTAGTSPYVIMDEDDAGLMSSHAAPSHTPAQEAQAEAEQVAIYTQLAIPLVDAALQWYNTCMFAYGQTGSGKTYTMMGTPQHPGLIPRLCRLLFAEVASRNAAEESNSSSPALITLQLSYMEIYNEQVRDLLKQRPKNAILRYKSRFDKKDVDSDEYRTLKVRHHPSKGIYVDGLTSVPVRTWGECEMLLQQGNALRTQCSTALNTKSSRSHAIFQLQLTQRESTGGRVRGREVALETFSKMNLVDLAGSERNTQAKTTGKHLAEANSINASLSTLRRVLDGLIANRAIAQSNNEAVEKGAAVGRARRGVVIPFRESLLTYVLSDNLGGNSFTVMCANVSPGAANAGETESTLRYATLAKSVVNHAKLNEAPTARVIREMRDRLRTMQEALRSAPDPSHVAELEEGVLLSEELLREMKNREENYEAQLHQQAEQAEALRQAVEAHKKEEAHWRLEAQRQQREVAELREALFEATQNGSIVRCSPGAPKTKGDSGRSDVGCSGPLDVDSLNILKSASSTDLQVGTTEGDVGALGKKKKKTQKQNKKLPSSERGQGEGDGDLLSPASRDWKPVRTRGTPLSLMGIRGKRRSSQIFLPVLPGAPASAPMKGVGVGEGTGDKGLHAYRSSSGSNSTVATTHLSGQLQNLPLRKPPMNAPAPRPPLSKVADVQAKSSDARAKKVWKSEESEGAVTYKDAFLVNGSTMEPGGDDARRVEAHLNTEPPSFYQTEQFLVRAAEATGSGDEQEVLDDAEDSDADRKPNKASQRFNGHAEAFRPFQGKKTLELHELLDMQLIQEQAEALCSNNTRLGGGLEIEGVAATPSQHWPTQPPRVAAARRAQAAHDRNRTSSIAANVAAAATAKKSKKKSAKKTAPQSEPREASAESANAWMHSVTSVTAKRVGVEEVVCNAQQQRSTNPLQLKPTAQDDGADVDSLTSGISRSPCRDEGLTDTHFETPECHEEEDSRTHLVSPDGDEGKGAALTAATVQIHHMKRGVNAGADVEGSGAHDVCPQHVYRSLDEHFKSHDDSYVDDLCADDTGNIAASLNRLGKPTSVGQQTQKKTKKKKSRGISVANSHAPVSERCYSTVDTLH